MSESQYLDRKARLKRKICERIDASLQGRGPKGTVSVQTVIRRILRAARYRHIVLPYPTTKIFATNRLDIPACIASSKCYIFLLAFKRTELSYQTAFGSFINSLFS
jgi:hypothetical protein